MPSTFRLFCMLDTAEKMFEKRMRTGLAEVICAAAELFPTQFSFRAEGLILHVVIEVVEVIQCTEAQSR